jgi:hypothetical protein
MKPPVRIRPRIFTIDREINDEDIWYIKVTTNGRIKNTPYGKTDLDQAFKRGTGDWDCKVLLRFIKGSPINIEKF